MSYGKDIRLRMYIHFIMEREGFEPTNLKERIYSPPRLASSLSLRISISIS